MEKLLPDIAANSMGFAVAAERYRPYPAYRDAGVEWLKEVPAHWVVVRMWQVSEAISGGTPERDEPRYWDGTIPWVSPKDMKRRLLGYTEERVTERGRRDAGLKLINPPAVLVVVRGMILAHSFPVAVSTVPLTINQDMKALKLRTDNEPRFFGWLLDGISRRILSTVVEKAAHGTRAIRMDHWRMVDLPLPPVSEQCAVADFLDCETGNIDALVAKKERLIELLREKRTALIAHAVTMGIDPHAPMKDSGVEWTGEIPDNWDVAPIYARYEVALGKMLDAKRISGSFPGKYLRNVDVQWDSVNTKELPTMDFSPQERERYGLQPGDVLVCEGGEVGRTAMWQGSAEECFYQKAIHRVRPKSKRDIPRFFFYLMCVLSAKGVFVAEGNPNTINHLTATQFRHCRVIFPLEHQQRAIAAYLDRETTKIDALVAKVREAIDRLRELRTALIAAAVTGKIDVRETPA